MYRKQGNWGYRSSLTHEPIELKQCTSDYVAHRTPHAQRGNQGFRRVSTAQGLKLTLTAQTFRFYVIFVISLPLVQTRVFRASLQFFFTRRRRSAVIEFLGGSHKISQPLSIKSRHCMKSQPLPPKSPKTFIFGDLSMQNLLQREHSVSPALMELRS